MPRETNSKALPEGSKPYPEPSTFTKAQVAKIAKAVALALSTADTSNEQTYSEDEDEPDNEEDDNTMPETLSSSPTDPSLLSTLAPLEEEHEKSTKMLQELHSFLAKFVATNNQPGIIRCSSMIVRHQGIVTDTNARIVSIKEAWAAQELARKSATEQLVTKGKKVKGKARAPPNEGQHHSLFAPHHQPARSKNPLLLL
jgi:hypothetical protein